MGKSNQRTPLGAGLATAMALLVAFAATLPGLAAHAEGRTVACFVLPKNDSQGQASAVMSSILREQMRKLVGVSVRIASSKQREV